MALKSDSSSGHQLLPGIAREVTTMLLDVDGTLVDSNDAHANSWVGAFASAGMNVPFEAIRPLIGMGADKLLPAIDPALGAEDEPGKTIAKRRGEIFKADYLDGITATPGARELLVTLKRQGIRCVVATSAKADELETLLQRANLADLIDCASTSEDAKRSKPSPDIIAAALEKSGTTAHNAVMLGDTKYDIEAAAKAQIPTIALRCGGSADAELAQAEKVFDDPAAFERALRGEANAQAQNQRL